MLFDNSTYHYPPELMTLLVQTIPLLCKSKKDVLLFFRGAGTKDFYISDLSRIVERNKDSITKYEITRDILTRLNEAKDKELATRREILKRIVEFDSFASCWDSDVLKAKGCVSEVQKIVNVKDSFTRMKIEREEERKRNIDKHTKEIEAIKEKNKSFEEIKQKFYALFSSNNPQERGRELEKVLNIYEVKKVLKTSTKWYRIVERRKP